MASDYKMQIRFNDLDAYGHVNNANYLSLMEYARTSSFGKMVEEGLKNGIWYVVTEADIKYKKAIHFGEDVYITVWMSEALGAKFTIKYVIHDGRGKVFALASTVHAVFNSVTGRPMRLGQEIKERVEPDPVLKV